jgi:hypothetical protein
MAIGSLAKRMVLKVNERLLNCAMGKNPEVRRMAVGLANDIKVMVEANQRKHGSTVELKPASNNR